MNRIADILNSRNALMLVWAGAAAVLLFLAPQAAINVDEVLHYSQAQKVVNWYFTGGSDGSCLSSPEHNLQYYGQSVDNFTALVNRLFSIENEYLTRHYTGAFMFWTLLLFSSLLSREVTGSYFAGMLTVAVLMLSPRLMGQAFGNLKDVPFAAGYVAAIYFMVRYFKHFPKVSWRKAIALACAIAFTCSVRIGGLVLLAYWGMAFVVLLVWKPFLLKYIVSTKPCFVKVVGQGTAIVLVAYFGGLLFWPYALQDVLRHPLESLAVMEHYKVSIKQIFNGEVYWSSALPPGYLFKWLLISTPEFYFPGLVYFIAFLTYLLSKPVSEQLLVELFVLFVFAFPVAYVTAIGANLYSGIRQMLFVVPPLAIMASVGVYRLFQRIPRRSLKVPAVGLVVALMALPLHHQASTFPIDYVYFNAVSGGNKAAWGNYEYDYYFHGMKEATEYLRNLVKDREVTVAMNTRLPVYFENDSNIHIIYTRYMERSSADWDYGIFGINYIHPWMLKHNTWQPRDVIKIFSHKGNPLVVLVKRTSKDDCRGIRACSFRNWEEGAYLLRKAIDSDPQNIWLYVQLANVKLAKGEFREVEELLANARKINPFYEPVFVLEAQMRFTQKQYDECVRILKELKQINPRYKAAISLWRDVTKKLNMKS